MKNPNRDNWCTDQASNQVPNKYRSRAISLHLSVGTLQIYEDCITGFGVLEKLCLLAHEPISSSEISTYWQEPTASIFRAEKISLLLPLLP